MFLNLGATVRSNFNAREFNSREVVQFFQCYSKRFPSFLTIFGHKIALFFPQLLTTKRDLISINEGQHLRFENSKKTRVLAFERI